MKNFTNLTISHDSLVPENIFILKIVAIYTVLLFFISIITNTSLIRVIIKNKKELLHHVNILSLALGLFNLTGTLAGLPVAAITALKHK